MSIMAVTHHEPSPGEETAPMFGREGKRARLENSQWCFYCSVFWTESALLGYNSPWPVLLLKWGPPASTEDKPKLPGPEPVGGPGFPPIHSALRSKGFGHLNALWEQATSTSFPRHCYITDGFGKGLKPNPRGTEPVLWEDTQPGASGLCPRPLAHASACAWVFPQSVAP